MSNIREFVELVNKAMDLAQEMDQKEQELNLITERIKEVVNNLDYLESKELTKEIERVLNDK